MVHCGYVNHHRPPLSRRCDVEVAALSPELAMDVAVNVSPKGATRHELCESHGTSVPVEYAAIQHTERWSVRYQYRVLVQFWLDGLQIEPDLFLGLFVDTSHERWSVLIADEIEDTVFDTLSMKGAMIVRWGSQLDPVIVSH